MKQLHDGNVSKWGRNVKFEGSNNPGDIIYAVMGAPSAAYRTPTHTLPGDHASSFNW
ncbi:MAG: hypothetical protein NT011_03840 [Kiritimatiellaeota bacterium]|nr:hypothetical protein [Kiritimatiellota bacterium]